MIHILLTEGSGIKPETVHFELGVCPFPGSALAGVGGVDVLLVL
jgi:hypothetical protein